jgi:hypothetical protein
MKDGIPALSAENAEIAMGALGGALSIAGRSPANIGNIIVDIPRNAFAN